MLRRNGDKTGELLPTGAAFKSRTHCILISILTLRPEIIIHKGRRPGVVRSTKNTNTVRLVLHVELLDVDLDNRLALRNVTSPPQYIRQKSM